MVTEGGFTSLNIEYLFLLIYRLLTGGADGGGIVVLLKDLWFGINTVAAIAVPLLLFGVLYAAYKKEKIVHAEKERYEESSAHAEAGVARNERWQEVLDLVNSENPSNWRLAVLHADAMLDDLLKRLGYLGDTLGERLKSVDDMSFRTLNRAWEAHKVRNAIGHPGSDFVLSQREARRIIELYRMVFEEHGVI